MRRCPTAAAVVGPDQGFASMFFQQAFTHHETEITPCPPPGLIGGFVNDVAQIIKTARISRLSSAQPFFTGLAPLPGLGGEAQNFNFHATALEGSGEDIGTGCGNGYGTATHGTGIIEQQGHHGIAELVSFPLERKRCMGQ